MALISPAPCTINTQTITTTQNTLTGLTQQDAKLSTAGGQSLYSLTGGLYVPYSGARVFRSQTPIVTTVTNPAGSNALGSVSLTIPANPFGLASIPAAPYNKYVMQVTATTPRVAGLLRAGSQVQITWTAAINWGGATTHQFRRTVFNQAASTLTGTNVEGHDEAAASVQIWNAALPVDFLMATPVSITVSGVLQRLNGGGANEVVSVLDTPALQLSAYIFTRGA